MRSMAETAVTTKAMVLPEPVSADPTRLRPLRLSGRVDPWGEEVGVGGGRRERGRGGGGEGEGERRARGGGVGEE